jgi:hypothetical protein
VRALVEALATVAPGFLAATVDLEVWTDRYGLPVSAWRQPRTAAEPQPQPTEMPRAAE